MQLTLKKAYAYLVWANTQNAGRWIAHSYCVGKAAGLLAGQIDGMDKERAESYGFLHDIGRAFGEMKMDHVFKGYYFLLDEGYEDAARICLTHSFPLKDIKSVTGQWDSSQQDYDFLEQYLQDTEYTLYDKLIQLCDIVGETEGFIVMEKRMIDIMMRYGIDSDNMLPRWQKLFKIKEEIEVLMGTAVENILGLKSVNNMWIDELILENDGLD